LPNYITHWLIAERTAENLKDTVFEIPAARHRHCLLIGAIFHDALFYLPSSSPLKGYMDVAFRLHGDQGEDTYEILKDLAETARRGEGGQELLAFLAGLVCHIKSDAAFHPFVFFHTGRVNPESRGSSSRATQAHRRLESILDMHFAGGIKGIRAYSLKDFLRKADPWMDRLYTLAGELLSRPGQNPEKAGELARALEESLARFGRAQLFFQNRFLQRILFGLRGVLGDPLREISALGHHGGLKRYLPRVRGPMTYHHPVLGKEGSTTLEELFTRSVMESVMLLREISRALAQDISWIPERSGPCLSSGLPVTPARRMNIFSPVRLAGPRNRSHG